MAEIPTTVIAPATQLTATVLTTSPKPGWKTTEFYGAWAVKILGALMAAGVFPDSSVAFRICGAALTLLGFLGYTYSRTVVKTAAALLLVFGLSAPQAACSSSTRQREANAAAAFLDCELGQFAPGTFEDAKAVAVLVVKSEISGTGEVDANRLKADAAPLKSSLLRCAWDAAIAALANAGPSPAPGAPASSAAALDRSALGAAWSDVRLELAWPPPRKL
jgi:hypothetical protein